MTTGALGCLGVNMNNIKKVCFICFLFLVEKLWKSHGKILYKGK